MKRWICISLALIAPLRSGAEDERAFLRFANKGFDQLSGSIDSLENDRMVWNSPILERPTPFFVKNLLELTLPTVIQEFKADHEATLTLNLWPDQPPAQVKGQLVAVTDDKIVIDTWYAGRMEFRRVMVKRVDIEDRASLLYSGPTGLDGWTQAEKNPAWTYNRGTLRAESQKPIVRNLDLPDDCCLAFEMAWKGQLSARIGVFSDADPDGTNRGYQINCQGGYATINRGNGGGMFGGDNVVSIPEFREDENVHLEIRTGRKSGQVCLYVNGRYAANWKDPDAAKSKMGGAISFAQMGGSSGSSLSISRIKVTTWDGIPEELPEGNVAMMGMGIRRGIAIEPKEEPKEKSKGKAEDEGRMKLRNGDSLSGEVTAISDGIMHVKTPFAEIKLPVSRVRNIMLKPASLEEPIRRNGDVRAWFPDGSSIVFRMDALTKETIAGSSQTFGKAEFKLSAFNRIEFNIHDPATNDLREELEK
ncbi:MAG: hypothetical protein J0M04_10280 [Verrucomicrobia bacterium]|nr:hypothetical protein [Verrucomicrobiota bacterium]